MDNISPKFWGRGAWTFLHCIVRSYPENPTDQEKATFRNFFFSLKDILPCMKCRRNYDKDINIIPINEAALANKQSLLDWWVKFRNEENKNIDQPANTLEGYDSQVFSPKQNVTTAKSTVPAVACIIGIVIILVLLFLAAKRFRQS